MKQLEQIMQKEVSRKEFLALVGAGLVSIFGFSQVLKALLGNKERSQNTGYGTSTYGGQKR